MGPHLAGAVVAAALTPLRRSTASHTLLSPTLTVSTPSLLPDRATTYVKYLETTAPQLQMRLQQAENEVQRLRT